MGWLKNAVKDVGDGIGNATEWVGDKGGDAIGGIGQAGSWYGDTMKDIYVGAVLPVGLQVLNVAAPGVGSMLASMLGLGPDIPVQPGADPAAYQRAQQQQQQQQQQQMLIYGGIAFVFFVILIILLAS